MMCKILGENTKSILQGDQQLLTTLCKLDIHYSERDHRLMIVGQVSCTWTCKVSLQAASSHYAARFQHTSKVVIHDQKLFMSKVKYKIRKEGKDRKKDVVGLLGIFSLLPCSFLLDVTTSL